MSNLPGHFLPVFLIMGLILSGCNIPFYVAAPEVSPEDIASTAVAGVFTQQAAVAAPSATPAAAAAAPDAPPVVAQCSPTVTATTDANVRAGDSTEYAVIGNLPYGGTAVVAGTNAAHTWWYIVFAGGPGGYGWISGSVVTTACLPAVVQVVVAPPLPAAPPPVADEPTATNVSVAPWIPLLRKLPTPTPIFFQINPNIFQQIVPSGD